MAKLHDKHECMKRYNNREREKLCALTHVWKQSQPCGII